MELISLLIEVIPCLLSGYLLGRYKENFSQVLAAPLIKYGIPVSLMGLLLKTGITFQLIESAALALMTIGLQILIICIIPKLKKDIASKTLKLGSSFGNTGYFGIPISLAFLPNQALSYSLGFDLGATLAIWTLGPFLITNNSQPINKIFSPSQCLFKLITKSPASKGLIGALLIQLTPWTKEISNTIWIPSKLIIFLALIIVGMELGWLRDFSYSSIKSNILAIKSSLILKLLGLPSLMLCICLLLRVPNIFKSALVLQAAAPTAISVLLIAQSNSHDKNKATQLVTFSTLLSLLTLPLWALILKIV